MRSGEVSADNPSVALLAPAPFPQGSLRLTALKTPACKAAKRRAGQQVLSTEAGSRPGDLRPAAAAALLPPKPLRGQVDCRCFQQKQAADQGLPSPVPGERSRKGCPLPGFRRKPERIRIIFPGDMRGGKNSSRGATCRGRLGGPGAQAECHRHRRNAGAGSWKWLRHFHETPHGAKCRRSGFRRVSAGTRAQCFAIVSAPLGR